MMGLSGLVRQWWHQPSRYDWFSDYLERQGMIGVSRAFLALAAVSLGVVPLTMFISDVPPRGVIGDSLGVVGGIGGLCVSVLFIRRWPTRRQSIIFAVTANAAIACASLAQSSPDAAIHACTGFAVLGGYIAVFHTASLLTYNLCSALAVSAAAMLRLSAHVGMVAAGCAFAVVVIANLAAPFGVQIVVHTLGADVALGDYDPLTGLLSRTAFYRNAVTLRELHADGDESLIGAMIDLDRFKQLNDTHGHSVGDSALIAVGLALRTCASPTAVLGRVGGEEFGFIDVVDKSRPRSLGSDICTAVAGVPYPVTASVGTATMSCAAGHDRRGESAIADIIAAADTAMYEAKRRGGNQSIAHGALRITE